MKSKRIWTGTAATLGMLVLILDSRTALEGMGVGIDLCLKTLIPSLFPFFFLSILLTGSFGGSKTALLLTGFLGGYPVGAQTIALAWERGEIHKSDAEHLLSFCSNAGPAFLFGIVGQAFDRLWIPWALWGIHIITALAVGAVGGHRAIPSRISSREPVTPTAALRKSLGVMAQVCGWVVLFRMLLTYFDKWLLWMLPKTAGVIISGILELSNGCVQLRDIPSEGARFLAASAMLALGGLCVTLQTVSVTQGLSLRCYFPGKLLQAALSLLATYGVQLLLPAGERCRIAPAVLGGVLLVAAMLARHLRASQKNCSIPAVIGV